MNMKSEATPHIVGALIAFGIFAIALVLANALSAHWDDSFWMKALVVVMGVVCFLSAQSSILELDQAVKISERKKLGQSEFK